MISTLLFLALAADYPEMTISNGAVTAKLMLPDAQKGSYQGTRFDWSGIISSLTYSNHEYFGQWYPKHDPKIHDAITGPVEEFLSNDAGLGYAEAKPGETFITRFRLNPRSPAPESSTNATQLKTAERITYTTMPCGVVK